MNLNGGGVTNLTSTFARTPIDPEWSPRGDLIAFSDGGDVHVMGPDGTPAPRLVTTLSGNQRYPSWSPDGSKIAFADIGEVGTVNADGSGETTILSGRREVWDLAWSPNGQRIAFIEDDGTDITIQEELFMMNADGSGVRRLGVDTNISIDWGIRAAGPSPPVIGETATVREVKGKVFVGIPSSGARAAQKGIDFVPLDEARGIPIGSFVDTRKGTVALSTARDKAGKTQVGRFSAGLFQVLQSRKRSAKGLTELRLKGSTAGFRSCGEQRVGERALAPHDPPPARERQGPLPHPRPPLRRDGPRHHLDGRGPLRRHAHHRQARRGGGARLPAEEDDPRQGGEELPGAARRSTVVTGFSRFASVLVVVLGAALVTPASATFPGENGKLLFELSQIFSVNPDGSDLTPLTPEFGGIVGDEPAVSPDGRLIAFDFAGAAGRYPRVGNLGHVQHRARTPTRSRASRKRWPARTPILLVTRRSADRVRARPRHPGDERRWDRSPLEPDGELPQRGARPRLVATR